MMLPLLLLAAEAVTPKTPTIDPSVAAEYWRNRAQVVALKADLATREAHEQALVVKLIAACGKDHQPLDDNGLKCVAKPKEKAKE